MNTTTFLGDKPIKRMGFGAMQLAGPGVFGPPRDPYAARAVLRRAIELGVDPRALRADAADSRNDFSDPTRGEHGCYRDRAR
jgi:hypothetical protein